MKTRPWVVPSRAGLEDIVETNVIEEVEIKVTAEFIEPMLATLSNNKKIFTDYIAEKMGDYQGKPLKTMEELEEEIEACPESKEKTATSFPKDTFGIFMFNYMILGNIKANIFILMCNGAGKVLNYKKSADLFCKVGPRKIRFYRKNEQLINNDSCLERSCRTRDKHGSRTFLAKSDTVEPKTRFNFNVRLLRNDRGLTTEILVNALKLGKENGLGQWRGSGGYGTYKILSLKYV